MTRKDRKQDKRRQKRQDKGMEKKDQQTEHRGPINYSFC